MEGSNIMNRTKSIRKYILSIICVSLFLVIATTFVYIPKQENLLSSLAFLQNQQTFYMKDLSSGILLQDASPMKDSKALENDPYRFEVVNHSNSDITYQIVFRNNEEKAKSQGKEVLPNHYLRYSLISNDNYLVEPSTLSDDGILYTTTIKAHSSEIFDFRMWLDWEADNGAMNKIFIGKIEIKEIEK